MKLAALSILLLPLTLRATPVDPNVRDALTAMRDGYPATLVGPALLTERASLIEASEKFAKVLSSQAIAGNKACDRFNYLAAATAADVATILPHFTGTNGTVDRPDTILSQVRLQTELPSFELLARMMAEGKEGGYGFLVRHKNACKYRDRDAVTTEIHALAKRYKDFRIQALGTPGIFGFEKQTEQLLQLANRAETRRDQWQVGFMIGSLALSWGAWKILKKVAGPAFTSVMGVTGTRLLQSRFFVPAVSVTTAIFEYYMWNAIDRAVMPSFAERPEESPYDIRLPGWDETLKDTEYLVHSGLAEPHLYLSYLSAVKAEMAVMFKKWRDAHDEQLKTASQNDPEFERQFAEALWLAREAMFLKRQSPKVAAAQLPALLRQDWNLNVACGADKFLPPSSVRCLIGVRRIARALYAGQLVSPKSETADLILVNVTTVKDFAIKAEDARVRIDVPYKQPFTRSAPFIAAAYESSQVRVLFNFITQFTSSLERWNQSAAQPLEFDPSLTLSQQWGALVNLMRIREREPGLFARRSEVLLIGPRFRSMFERHLKLHEQIDATASLDQIANFLKQSSDQSVTQPEIARVERLRVDVAAAAKTLGEAIDLDVQCSDQRLLTLQRCLTTIQRVTSFAKRHPNFRPEAHVMLVTDIMELGENFELMHAPDEPKKLIWAVPVGFKMKDLKQAVEDRSWIADLAPAS